MDVKERTVAGLKMLRVMAEGWLLSAIVSVVGLLVSAFIFCLVGEGKNRLMTALYILVVLAVISGGFYVGRKMRLKRFLWGMILGGIYCAGLLLIAFFFGGMNVSELHFSLPFLLLCLGGGMFGGMIG